MENTEIAQLQQSIMRQSEKLRELQKALPGIPVKNYKFDTVDGSVSLKELFSGKTKLLVIHNMGQACRYCTLWGDGINGLLSHLESALSVVLVSKDPPQLQRTFANSRNWRMRLASHGGGEYMEQQVAVEGMGNMPGAVVYELSKGKILKKASTYFGPGDLFCPQWHFLGLAGIDPDDWTPQYSYWQRPDTMEDGGENLLGA